MAIVTVDAVTKQFGTQVVLNNISVEIQPRETVGMVGANGSGKTTLFRLITGDMKPDRGTITRARGTEIGLLSQEPTIQPDRALHDEVGSVFADLLAMEKKLHAVADEMAANQDDAALPELMERYERINARFIAAGGHTFETRLNEILGGLGFAPADYERPMRVLSGGQQCRASLGKVLLEDRTLLLLDEPTNHLDIDAVRWLEKFLAGHRGAAVVISHDRHLLDRVCDRIIEVSGRKVYSFPGNYTTYAETKALRELTQQRQFQKDQEFIEKERAFITKHIAGQRTKEAQGRRKRLERRLSAGEFVTETPRSRRSARIVFDPTTLTPGTVARCDDLCMRYGDNRLFDDLTLQVQAGQRFGITGPNGTGKSTLLKIFLDKVKSTGGECLLDPKRSVGYYAQESHELDEAVTMVDHIRAVQPALSEQAARSYLAMYLFTGEDVFKTLGQLSGGEQSRVRLASLILKAPDVLILDEPTNHLDIPSREVLEDSLQAFAGTIIVVSHDRYFLDRVVDRLLVIRPTRHAIYEGNYSAYIEQLEGAARGQQAASDAARKENRKRAVSSGKARKGGKSAAREKTKRKVSSAYDHLAIDELEVMMMEREEALGTLTERFGDPTFLRDPNALAALQEEVDEVKDDLAEIEAAWSERVDSQ